MPFILSFMFGGIAKYSELLFYTTKQLSIGFPRISPGLLRAPFLIFFFIHVWTRQKYRINLRRHFSLPSKYLTLFNNQAPTLMYLLFVDIDWRTHTPTPIEFPIVWKMMIYCLYQSMPSKRSTSFETVLADVCSRCTRIRGHKTESRPNKIGVQSAKINVFVAPWLVWRNCSDIMYARMMNHRHHWTPWDRINKSVCREERNHLKTFKS